MGLKAQLLAVAGEYRKRTGLSYARIATVVINDGKFFDRLQNGGSCTIATWERFMDFFARHGAPARIPFRAIIIRPCELGWTVQRKTTDAALVLPSDDSLIGHVEQLIAERNPPAAEAAE